MIYLSKSKFKLGRECPRKLYYSSQANYANKKRDNPFLQALAEGGFQVEELAKHYYPPGHSVSGLNSDQALIETSRLLEEDNVVIYEAAIKHENLFARVDILIKEGKQIKLIEIKAKSIGKDTDMLGRGEMILAGWRPYVEDIAFQTYIASKSLGGYEISPFLLLVDKDAKCPTDGLNQKFKLVRDKNGRQKVEINGEISQDDLSKKLLKEIDMKELCNKVFSDKYLYNDKEITFGDLLNNFSENYINAIGPEPTISKRCKDCEFVASRDELALGLRSGFRECFTKAYNWSDLDFEDHSIFDLWDNRRTDNFIKSGKLKLKDLTTDDIGYKENDGLGLSRTQRQWLQIEKSATKDKSYYIDREGLKKEMDSWTFPLNFIDFETASPAIPFKKGKSPYEGIAFQFSHHTIDEDGMLEHKSQYLNLEIGVDPNYDFVRELKKALEKNQGTIFKYSNHENVYLNMIYDQLKEDENHIPDKDDLLSFIREITEYYTDVVDEETGKSKRVKIEGKRNMIDMFDLVKKYYYDPHMKGSNSIKQVLPAILNSSKFLQDKYSKAVYGSDDIESLNFNKHVWVEFEDGLLKDPYSLLPKLFSDMDDDFDENIDSYGDELSDGGAAMTAYYRLQFEDIPQVIHDEISQALLKYCELDTLAMAMIYEGWKDMLG